MDILNQPARCRTAKISMPARPADREFSKVKLWLTACFASPTAWTGPMLVLARSPVADSHSRGPKLGAKGDMGTHFLKMGV